MTPRTIEEIKNETMLFSASTQFAKKVGGPLTKQFISFLDPTKEWIIDSRVHMLMEGWYPCIGGWHLDDVARGEDGQPDFKTLVNPVEHVLAVVDCGTESLTDFLISPIEITTERPKYNKILYNYWNTKINNMLKRGEAVSDRIENNTVIQFTSRSFHKGTPAKSSGWRFFIRASVGSDRTFVNEIRKQVNVYMPTEMGW